MTDFFAKLLKLSVVVPKGAINTYFSNHNVVRRDPIEPLVVSIGVDCVLDAVEIGTHPSHKFVLGILEQRICTHAIYHRAPFVHKLILVHEKEQYVPAGVVAAQNAEVLVST